MYQCPMNLIVQDGHALYDGIQQIREDWLELTACRFSFQIPELL